MIATSMTGFMSTRQVCERLGVDRRTLQRWAREKNYGPPFVKIGQRNRYDPNEVEVWVAQLGGRPPDARA